MRPTGFALFSFRNLAYLAIGTVLLFNSVAPAFAKEPLLSSGLNARAQKVLHSIFERNRGTLLRQIRAQNELSMAAARRVLERNRSQLPKQISSFDEKPKRRVVRLLESVSPKTKRGLARLFLLRPRILTHLASGELFRRTSDGRTVIMVLTQVAEARTGLPLPEHLDLVDRFIFNSIKLLDGQHSAIQSRDNCGIAVIVDAVLRFEPENGIRMAAELLAQRQTISPTGEVFHLGRNTIRSGEVFGPEGLLDSAFNRFVYGPDYNHAETEAINIDGGSELLVLARSALRSGGMMKLYGASYFGSILDGLGLGADDEEAYRATMSAMQNGAFPVLLGIHHDTYLAALEAKNQLPSRGFHVVSVVEARRKQGMWELKVKDPNRNRFALTWIAAPKLKAAITWAIAPKP